MRFLKLTGWCFVFFFVVVINASAEKVPWEHIKGKHFIIYYNFKEDTEAVSRILQKAEGYYNKIADRIGYSRYASFWTWDERVRIIIFPDQEAFMTQTGQPPWSRGYSNRDSALFKSRAIVTYRQEDSFIDGALPHEIGHLVFRDFIGFETDVPLWLEEGVAQLFESDRAMQGEQYMRVLVSRGQYVAFEFLSKWDIRVEQDAQKAKVFYLQSVSIVDFLLRTYGSSNFGYFCRSLKEGKGIEGALVSAYSSSFRTLKDLEKRWVSDIRK